MSSVPWLSIGPCLTLRLKMPNQLIHDAFDDQQREPDFPTMGWIAGAIREEDEALQFVSERQPAKQEQ